MAIEMIPTSAAISDAETGSPARGLLTAPSSVRLRKSFSAEIDAASAQTDGARLAEREFLVAASPGARRGAEEIHKRIDRLEHDNLQMRGLLHQHSLITRSLLPDPADEYAPRTPRVLARAGSRTLTERAANRVWPPSQSVPWFSEPYFNDAA